jgi:glutamine cyclotransferase
MLNWQIRYRVRYSLFILLVCLAGFSCQNTKKEATTPDDLEKPSITALVNTTYRLGDTISIQLNQPLSQATVMIDDKSASIIQRTTNALRVRSTDQKLGLHQLIISGTTANKISFSDTLGIELWSDVTPPTLLYSVIKTYPHQTGSFTQGLEFYKGVLYESTGLNGQSKLMQVDVPTGSIIKSVPLATQYFGEGITIMGDKIYQLTWTSGVCFRYSMNFTLEKTFTYPTQGWGLTHNDSTLILSDGSNRLYFLTPDFQRKGELAIYDDQGPVMNLNELEYVDGYVFANVWQTNRIVQIDLKSGKVVGYLDMEPILPAGIDTKANVLNGIAFQPRENALYLTGKNWPALYKIQLQKALKNKALNRVARR